MEEGSAPRRKKQTLLTGDVGRAFTLDFIPGKAAALHKGEVIDLQGRLDEAPWFVLNPLSQWRLLWDLLGCCFIGYQAVLIPAEFAFGGSSMSLAVPFNAWWIVEFAITVFFLIDFAMNCVTGYVTERGVHVWSPGLILRHYFLEFPFPGLIDLIAWLPSLVTLLCEATLGEENPPGYTLMSLCRLIRLLRTSRAMDLLGNITTVYIFSGRYSACITAILQVAGVFSLIVHWVSCVFAIAADNFGAAVYSDDTPWAADQSATAWEQYSYAIWWTVTTFAGGSPPTNPTALSDYWLWSAICYFFVLAVNVMVGVFCAIVDKFMQAERDLQDQLEVATRFASTHGLSDYLKRRVLATVRAANVQQQREGSFVDSIEPLLSEDLRRKIKGAIFDRVLKRFPPFKTMSTSFLNSIASNATYRSYVADDRIFKEGEEADSMVVLTSGSAVLHSETLKFHMPYATSGWWLDEGAILGNTDSPNARLRPFSCVALEPSMTLEISREVLEAAMDFHTCTRETLGGLWCPVCCEQHKLWECRVLISVDGDSDDESGSAELQELGKASKALFERRSKKTMPASSQNLPPHVKDVVIAGPMVPAVGANEVPLSKVVAQLGELLQEVRAFGDKQSSLTDRIVSVETGICGLNHRFAAIESKLGINGIP